MKRLLCSLLTLGFGWAFVPAAAQEEGVRVHGMDGTVAFTELQNLRKIVFSKDETAILIYTKEGRTESFDLNKLSKLTFLEVVHPNSIVAAPFRQADFSVSLNEALCISAPDYIRRVSLYDLSGKLLYVHNAAAKELEINLSSFEKGVCIVKVRTDGGVGTRKIIVK